MSEDIFTRLETAYAERLAQRATEWQTRHPEQAKEIRDAVVAKFRRPGMAEPEPGSLQWQVLEAAVVEAIRAKKGWPTLREYERLNAGHELPPPVRPLRPLAVVRDVVDHKAKAAGE